MKTQNITGIIELEEMEFFAYHGCYEEEQIKGNKFLVNITVETDVTKPAETDCIDDALNYVEIYKLTENEMNITSHLLENVAARIIDKLFKNFDSIIHAEVKVSKLTPRIDGLMKMVSLTLKR